MGWGNCGTDSEGRPIGYSFKAQCDHSDCNEPIDRGLSYACGGMHGEDEYSCEKYFCEDHLSAYLETSDSRTIRICQECAKQHLESGEWFEDDDEGVLKQVPPEKAEPCKMSQKLQAMLDAQVFPEIPDDYVPPREKIVAEYPDAILVIGTVSECNQCGSRNYGLRLGCKCWAELLLENFERTDLSMTYGVLIEGKEEGENSFISNSDLKSRIEGGERAFDIYHDTEITLDQFEAPADG